MKRFRVGDIRLTLPTSWAEVSLQQFMTLADSNQRDPLFILSVLSGFSQEELRQVKAYDLDLFVFEYIDFIREFPSIPDTPPDFLTIDGKTVEMINDLGPVVSYGQMCDARFVINCKQEEQEQVTPYSMAPKILPIFLWSRLRSEPYTNWHEAVQLWDSIKTVNCIDGLSAAGFFLLNSLKPSPSGRIKEERISPMRLSKWLRTLHRAYLRSTRILRANV